MYLSGSLSSLPLRMTANGIEMYCRLSSLKSHISGVSLPGSGGQAAATHPLNPGEHC